MNEAVQKIKDRLSITDVVAPYVELHKAGRNFKGRSPFSNEKTPSFYVSPERGMYYCFSTSQGGDMFTFVEKMEGVDFKEALKILAEKANVELVPISKEKATERERSYEALREATLYFARELENRSDMKAYLTDRGLTRETIEKWQIGFAPGPPEGGWRDLRNHLKGRGFNDQELFKVGLIKESAPGKEPYDVFRRRIMFPLFDQSGRPVAFSGRILISEPETPKYVNSPETELYKKSELLFGYHLAKNGIRDLGFSLIVEGQFDVVLSHQAGYINTVAVSGTALTLEHIKLLERHSDKVVLALDADRAGINAMRKAASLMLARGFDVKVAPLPDGKDPADIVKEDAKEFKKIIGHSVPVIEFFLQVLQKQNLEERAFKLRAREEVLPYVVLLPNRIDQDYFEGKIAEVLNTTKEAVHFEVERLREIGKSETTDERGSEIKKEITLVSKREDRHQINLAYIVGTLTMHERGLTDRVKSWLESLTGTEFSLLEEQVPSNLKAEVIFKAELSLQKTSTKSLLEELFHNLNQFRDQYAKWQLGKLRLTLQELESSDRNEEMEEALKAIARWQNELKAPSLTIEVLYTKVD